MLHTVFTKKTYFASDERVKDCVVLFMAQTQSQSVVANGHDTENEPLKIKQSTPCCIYCCSITMLIMAILMLLLFDDFAFFYDWYISLIVESRIKN